MSALINLDYEERLFELEQRKAKAMISGSILPQRYKNVGDVIILNEMSRNLRIPTIMLAQQLYVVKGTPAMSGQLSIALLNTADRFETVMKWEEEFTPKWQIRAYNKIDGDVVYGDWLDDEIIQANGWLSNPKWKTMKHQMARYRTASWYGRLYAPDVLLGFMEAEEVVDAEIIPTNVHHNEKRVDLNSLVTQNSPEPTQEVDELANVTVEVAHETINQETGEVLPVAPLTDPRKNSNFGSSIIDGMEGE